MNILHETRPFIIPISCVFAGLLLGMVTEKIIFSRLRKVFAKTPWKSDEIIINAVSGMPVLWGTVSGVYFAISTLAISQHLLHNIEKLLLIIVIFSITVVCARAGSAFINLYAREKHGILPSASIFTKITKLIVFVIGVLIILQSLGISITPIITALGVGGLAVSLALQDTLSNLFSGLQITISRQIKPGDYVRLDSGEEGYVTDITWRNTTIRALPNNMVVIPNSKLAGVIVTNYHLPEKEMAVLLQVGVSYDSDLKRVEEVTIGVARDVMKRVAGGVPDFEPFIRYHTFGDFSINFSVILRGREFVDQYLIKHEFIKRLHMRYNEEGIKIPFPVRTVYLKEAVSLN
jgi:small-conductance mechanosensitive channel